MVTSWSGVETVKYAWTEFNALQRDPLANTITGMLFAGFWVSLILILIDFAFYMAVTTRQRAVSFAVLQAVGWERRKIWSMLSFEQAAFITPALLVGVFLGIVVAYLVLPFMALIGSQALTVPLGQIGLLILMLVVAFTIFVAITANNLQKINATEAMHTTE